MSELLTVSGLNVEASTSAGDITLLDAVDLAVGHGEIVGLIGESGSGKTTLARSLIGLLERNVRVRSGQITFDGRTILGDGVNLLHQGRGRDIGMVFQGAGSSLDPLQRIGSQLSEVTRRHRPDVPRNERTRLHTELLAEMGFDDPERVLRGYPHHLSGGMRQRAAIALAVVARPRLLIADEATSALDVTVQADVVALLRTLVADRGMGMLFVTHDLLLAAELCHRMVVLRRGRIVEHGPAEQIIERPKHPYTQGLLAALPRWDDPVAQLEPEHSVN